MPAKPDYTYAELDLYGWRKTSSETDDLARHFSYLAPALTAESGWKDLSEARLQFVT